MSGNGIVSPVVISATDPVIVELFSGLQPRKFARLITQLRRDGADRPLRGRPWGLWFEDRVLGRPLPGNPKDCRLRGDGVSVAMAGVATLANLAHAQ
ncbi:hypothetical protein [Nocardia sp. NPDC060259]|uniref:hypothetical protein n=1 Tax=Nocardia sp. NPDC060259 TaxID=3347088 RepID=UPI00364EF41D